MQRRFFSNLSLLFLLNGLIKPIWIFGIDRKVQITLGSAQYGAYYALLNLAMIFNIVLDIGISNFANREVAHKPELAPQYMGSLLMIKGLLLLLYITVVFIMARVIHVPLASFSLLGGIIAIQALLSLLQFFRAHLGGLHLFVKDSMISVFDKLVIIILIGSMLYGGVGRSGFNIYTFVSIQWIALAMACLLAYGILLKAVPSISFKINRTLTFDLLKESRPYALMVLLMAAYNRIDGVMLSRLAGDAIAGQYVKDFRLLDACGQFGVLFAGLLLPMFVRLIKEGRPVDALAGSAFNLLFAMAGFLATLTTFYALTIHKLLYHEQSATVLGIILWAFMGNAAMYVFSTLLTAHGSIFKMIILAISGLCMNITINAFITPANGIQLAAIACTATQCTVAGLAIYYCYRLKIITLDIRYWLRLGLLLGLMVAGGYAVSRLHWSLFSGILTIGVITMAGLFAMRMIRLSQVGELLKRPTF